MKKIVLLFLVICTSLCINAQIINVTSDSLNYREYENRYLFNHCSREGINLDIVEWATGFANGISYSYYKINSGQGIHIKETSSRYSPASQSNILVDFAQPYYINTPITIAGISGFVGHYVSEQFQDSCRWYFEIWDSTLTTVLRSIDITDTTIPHIYYDFYIDGSPSINGSFLYYKYTERFFNEPLTISGKFYIVYHTPDSVFYPINYTIDSHIAGNTTCMPGTELYPLERGGYENEWRYCLTNQHSPQQSDTITALYLFPILADNNASDLNSVGDLESVRVFPNPTENEVNINSGYRIERIFLYDESGKLLQEKAVKTYNYKIDLQQYPQGSYLLKVQTSKNQTTHKIIRQ